MKISVIVPVYNCEDYLYDCLNSIVNQTYKNLEIILIDDGSSDKSGQICDEFKKNDNRICVVHQKNQGVSDTRNLGLSMASGEYIGFVDSDDFLCENMYEILADSLSSDVDVVSCSYSIVYDRKILKNNNSNETIIVNGQSDIILFSLENKHFCINIWNKLFKKSIIYEHNLKFDTQITYGEDLLWFISYITHCNKAIFIKNDLYMYFQNEQGAMSKVMNSKKLTMFKAYENTIALIEKEDTEYNLLFKDMITYIVNYATSSIRFSDDKLLLLSELQKYARKNLKECIATKDVPLLNKLHIGLLSLSKHVYYFFYTIFYKIHG